MFCLPSFSCVGIVKSFIVCKLYRTLCCVTCKREIMHIGEHCIPLSLLMHWLNPMVAIIHGHFHSCTT